MASPSLRYSFGPFEIARGGGELRKFGRPVKLSPQPFQLLILLVERAGDLVTREELQAALWADGTTVEFDQGLNYCIRQIRIALGDDARDPIYVETIPKRGYRFVAPVIPVGLPEANSAPPVPPSSRWRRPWILAAVAAALFVLAGFTVWPKGPNLPRDPHVRQLFLEAEHLAGMWEPEKVLEAAKRYDEVTRIDPGFAPAWAGWTNADIALASDGPSPAKSLADSEVHARKALSLDDSLSSAHAALGHSYWQQWKWKEADEEFRKALDGDGGTSVAHQLYGLYLASAGRKQEAVQHARKAVEMEPVSGLFNYSLAQVYLQTGNFEAALAQAEKTLKMDRHFPSAFQTLLRANIQLGRLGDAEHALQEELRMFPNRGLAPWSAYLLGRQGRIAEARNVLEAEGYRNRKNPHPSLGHIAAFVGMGDLDAAAIALQSSVSGHVQSMLWVWTAPELAPLRADPRFEVLVHPLGRVPAKQ